MLWRYAIEDSAGVMEVYLLYGEFTDGYISEGAFMFALVQHMTDFYQIASK